MVCILQLEMKNMEKSLFPCQQMGHENQAKKKKKKSPTTNMFFFYKKQTNNNSGRLQDMTSNLYLMQPDPIFPVGFQPTLQIH